MIFLVLACGGQPDDSGLPPVCEDAAPLLEVAQRGDYGEMTDGADVMYGHPPQGGAPFSPFRFRITGLVQPETGYVVTVEAYEDEELLGESTYHHRFLCADVGEHDGTLVASEVHLRYTGWSLDELEDRSARFDVVVEGVDDALTDSFAGTLRRE